MLTAGAPATGRMAGGPGVGGAPPGPTRPSAATDARPTHVPGELLVRFDPSTAPGRRNTIRTRYGLTRIAVLPVPGLELVRSPGRVPEQAARVTAEPAVRYAEPNHLWYPAQALPPDDPEFGQLWAMHNTGQTGGTPGADIDALTGWDRAVDTGEVVVAVIDTGVWTEHPDLVDRMWVNEGEILDGTDSDGNGFVDDLYGWDFYNDDNSVFDPLDGDDHGTHVAGTVAATMGNGIGIAGVSQARIMPLKFLGPGGGTTADAIRALDYALAMGAHVTNNSWGGISFSASLRSKIQQANSAGQLFVAAAGNDTRNTDTIPHYPSSFDVANIISVAATTHADGLATFSNHGATSVDLGAPGSSILSTVPPFSKAVLRARTASTGAVGHHTFGLEGMATAGERATLLGAALDWMEVGADDPILVVDDDGGASFETHYQSALDTLGYEAVATTQQLGSPTGQQGVTQPCPSSTDGPSAATMSGYRAVVWLAGATWRCTLTPTDQTNLATYVNGQTGAVDRNLLLFGQDIGFDLTRDGTQASTFMHGVLRADFVADQDLNFRVSPPPGSPYAGVPGLVLNGADPATASGGQRWSSAVAPRPGAVTGLLGADTAWFSGTSMAAPHVTGAVAHLLARFPWMGHLNVKARVMDDGDPLAALNGRSVSGKRLNLAQALAAEEVADARIAPLGGRFQRDRRFRVRWSAAGDVASFRVQHRWRHFNGGASSWSLLGTYEVDETTFNGRPGRTHCFRVRAHDAAGNGSEWSPARCTTVPLNDGALSRHGAWSRVTDRPAHFLGSFSRAQARGATLGRPGARRAVDAALVVTTCPRCGRVEIRWRGNPVRRLNLRSPQRRVLRLRPLPGVTGRGRLEVEVLSRGRPVLIEGLGIAVRP